MDVQQQIELLFKRKKLPIELNIQNNKSTIDDVIDGEVYKRFRHKVGNNSQTYSFTLSTDVISLCEKSSLTFI